MIRDGDFAAHHADGELDRLVFEAKLHYKHRTAGVIFQTAYQCLPAHFNKQPPLLKRFRDLHANFHFVIHHIECEEYKLAEEGLSELSKILIALEEEDKSTAAQLFALDPDVST